MTRIEEIYEAVLPEMKANGIEDTPANRHDVLKGLLAGWMEDSSDDCIEKTFYKMAVTLEMTLLRIKMRYQV